MELSPYLRLTAHAAEMIEARGIALEWVMYATLEPDWSEPDPRDPALTRSYRSIQAAEGRILRVVHRKDGDTTIIITAHFDRGAKRP